MARAEKKSKNQAFSTKKIKTKINYHRQGNRMCTRIKIIFFGVCSRLQNV